MKALIYKELKLSMHPTVYIFFALSAMLLIPSYPYYVAFYYTCLSIFFVFLNGRETKDVLFTVLLPIRKRDCVKARLISITLIELIQIALSVPFAVLSTKINPNGGNAVGIEPNVAFYGLVLVMYTIFNLVYVPAFYKTAYNIGKPFVKASVLMFLFIAAAESLVHIPTPLKGYLDASDSASQLRQLPVLAAGILIYALGALLTLKLSGKRLEAVDLS